MPPVHPIITPSFLTSLRATPHLPRRTWYFISTVTLSMLNRPEEIWRVFTAALENATVEGRGADVEMTERRQTGHGEDDEREDALLVARKTRDALIKSIAVGGLPKAINSLYALKRVTPAALLDDATDPSPTLDRCRSPEDLLAGGQSLFDRVYGKVSTRVMSQMDRCGTPDLGIAARWTYGGILSGGQTRYSVLSPMEISFVLMAGLIPQDVNPQLKGHLKGALNNGASEEQVNAVRHVVIRLCEDAGMRQIDTTTTTTTTTTTENNDKRNYGEGQWGWREGVAGLD